jgi:hypothetical protein
LLIRNFNLTSLQSKNDRLSDTVLYAALEFELGGEKCFVFKAIRSQERIAYEK